MKCWIPLCLASVLSLTLLLTRTAVAPQQFIGEWYSAGDGNHYLFKEGIVEYAGQIPAKTACNSISGAYVFCKDSILIYVSDVEGLESEKLLYPVRDEAGEYLCETKDGSGKVFFFRDAALLENKGR